MAFFKQNVYNSTLTWDLFLYLLCDINSYSIHPGSGWFSHAKALLVPLEEPLTHRDPPDGLQEGWAL